ncbi:hypothetical protein [Stackebrandtia soli]|uniref:hypothetical protein n=1 Tax=Stackebrandtia soli TaxID=1892856 RepID=UPI0039EA3A40
MTDEANARRLAAAVAQKAAIAWIAPNNAPERALWCVWVDDALYVVCGDGEQRDPGFVDGETATVVHRGDHGGRIVQYGAAVTLVPHPSPQWDGIAAALAPKRLNATGDTVARWADGCRIWRIAVPEAPETPEEETADETPTEAEDSTVPTEPVVDGSALTVLVGRSLPDDDLAAPVRPSTAARPTRKPFRLHRVKRRHRS